jgi:hypothetical protein
MDMNYAYGSETWQTFYATIAGATAALAGLLFVALSLHLRAIITNPALLGQAREALGGFLSILVLAILVLIPGQGRHLLGAELIASGFVLVFFSVHLQRQTLRHLPAQHRLHLVLHLAPINLGTAMILIAGISLLLGQGGGLFWLMPTVLLYLLNALNNAWMLGSVCILE